MKDLRKYNESYYNGADIAEKLMSIFEIKDSVIKEELSEAICQIEAIAGNLYNSNYWRVLYNVLLKFVEEDDE